MPTSLCAVRCRLATRITRRQQPSLRLFVQLLRLAFPSYFRSRRDLGSKSFVWFRAWTDKGIVCMVDHLHSVTAELGSTNCDGHAGQCWRSKDELISDVLLCTPHMAKQKQDDQLEHTYSSYVRIQDVALKTGQRRWTRGRSGERGSGISVLVARHDDDDDDLWRAIGMDNESQYIRGNSWTWW